MMIVAEEAEQVAERIPKEVLAVQTDPLPLLKAAAGEA